MSEIINKKYFTDESLSALGENIKNYVADAVDSKAESEHAHDDKYYTKNEMDTKLQHKSNATHNHDAKYDAIGAADTALASAKTYADEKVATLLDNSTEAVDSVMELAAAMKDNADAIEALEIIAAGKVDKVEGKGLSTNDYTSEEKAKLADIEDGANNITVSVTQEFAIGVKIGTITVNEDTTDLYAPADSDTTYDLEATQKSNENVKLNLIAAGGKNSEVEIKGDGATNVYMDTISGAIVIESTDTNTTYTNATTSKSGLMSSADKSKLNNIEDGANKTVVDETLSETSTNAIQNKTVAAAINELSALVGDTPVSDQITEAISDISFVDINLEDAESGTPTGINADTLGGYPPEYFLENGGGTSEHNHDDIYYTETEIDAKIAEIDGKFSEINASVANIVSGTTTVDNATKAVQDANGNVIADTYATKAYIEELIGGIENGTY